MGLVILIGASGAGKTTIAEAFESSFPGEAEILFFDRIGVPPAAEMIARHGSGEAWQRAMTIAWLARIAPLVKAGRNVLFEGQTRASFVAEAAATAGAEDDTLLLIDCDDSTRRDRLRTARRQPELDNPDMQAWARFLRERAVEDGTVILDTSAMKVDEAVAFVRSCYPR